MSAPRVKLDSLSDCQLESVHWLEGGAKADNLFLFLQKRIVHFFKRRVRFLRKNIGFEVNLDLQPDVTTMRVFEPGEMVRVKPLSDIQHTLDAWGMYRGCAFLQEMGTYCETTQRVLQRVERFLDERDYRIKKARGLYLLEGIHCRGTIDFGHCDRMCFYFWRREWLEIGEE